MEEQEFVSYETAVVARSKGFKGDCFTSYNVNKVILYHYPIDCPYGTTAIEECIRHSPYSGELLAPMQQQLKMWIWKTHKVYIDVVFTGMDAVDDTCLFKGFVYSVSDMEHITKVAVENSNTIGKNFNDYYKCMERCLMLALNTI